MRWTWALAALVALVAHAPLLGLLGESTPVPAPPASTPPVATIDLRTWRSPPRPRARLRSKGHGDGLRAASGAGSARRAPASPRPEHIAAPTPALGSAALEGVGPGDLAPTGGHGGGPGDSEAAAPRAFEASHVDVAPRRLAGAEPVYPRLDALAGRDGFVTLRFVVREDGTVSDLTVEEHRGPASLVEAAREAVLAWRFAPARKGGRAVACVCAQRLGFSLGGKP